MKHLVLIAIVALGASMASVYAKDDSAQKRADAQKQALPSDPVCNGGDSTAAGKKTVTLKKKVDAKDQY